MIRNYRYWFDAAGVWQLAPGIFFTGEICIFQNKVNSKIQLGQAFKLTTGSQLQAAKH